jgi:heterodisulfide reductase subunit A-like polyferredoxin
MNASKPAVLILGGGVAGLAAAQDLAAQGVLVHVVEKAPRLGGQAVRWACMATDACRYCGACLSAEMTDQVSCLKDVKIHLNCNLDRIEHREKGFQATLKDDANTILHVDAVLVATGMVPFDPRAIPDLGYTDSDQVITTADLNELLRQERLAEILPPTANPSIAFIQCVGSRDRSSGRDYCSQVCCKTAVRQVNKILYHIPKAEICLFHIDLQVIGKVFRSQAADMHPRVKLHQGVPAKIWNDREPGKVSVIQEDHATGARTARHFDLIVLAVGMDPSPQIGEIAGHLGVQTDAWGFFSKADGVLAPGVYVAGAAQGPTDILTAKTQGAIVAHRMATDMGWVPKTDSPPGIVILGGTAEAFSAASTLSESGYAVTLLDNGQAGAPPLNYVAYFPNVRLTTLNGAAGRYQVSYTTEGEDHQIEAAAIIAAAGIHLQPQLPDGPGVMALSDYVLKAAINSLKTAQTVAFWMDRSGPEWKALGRKCLQEALELAAQGKQAIVIMEKMLVYGMQGQRLYDQARHSGVRFFRVDGPEQVTVKPGPSKITLEVNEATLPGVTLTLNVDLVVVPEKVTPPLWAGAVSGYLRQSRDAEGFLQSPNVRHRPVGSPRQGIFFLGTCHDETDENDLEREIAAIKAGLYRLMHRQFTLEPPAVIDEGKCGRCLTCYRGCPHGAVRLRDKIQPEIIAEACVGCGICVSSCPARAIAADPQAQLPPVNPSAGDTVVFACRRSGALAAKDAQLNGPNTRLVEVRCAGQLDEQTLSWKGPER